MDFDTLRKDSGSLRCFSRDPVIRSGGKQPSDLIGYAEFLIGLTSFFEKEVKSEHQEPFQMSVFSFLWPLWINFK